MPANMGKARAANEKAPLKGAPTGRGMFWNMWQNILLVSTWTQIDYILLIVTLFSSLECPSGTHYLADHDVGLAGLITFLKCVMIQWECTILCDTKGSKCHQIAWSETQKNIVLVKAHEKNVDVHMDRLSSATARKGGKILRLFACVQGERKRKCEILYYDIKINLVLLILK